LAFVAQINLAEALPYDTEHVLPPAGMLYFFTDATQEYSRWDPATGSFVHAPDRWRVLYSEVADPGLLERVPYWIRRQDLERRDFTNVWFVLQCS
jgi:uncharacterized protein YwqG